MLILFNLADAFFRARCNQPHVIAFLDKSKQFPEAVEMLRDLAVTGNYAKPVVDY